MSGPLFRCLAAFSVLLLFTGSEAIGQRRRVLVLLDDTAVKSTHSLFFSSLTDRGYQITYSAANAQDLTIKDWDNYLYDKVIVFASSTSGVYHSASEQGVRANCSLKPIHALAKLLTSCCRVWGFA